MLFRILLANLNYHLVEIEKGSKWLSHRLKDDTLVEWMYERNFLNMEKEIPEIEEVNLAIRIRKIPTHERFFNTRCM